MAPWIKHSPTIITLGLIALLALHGRIAQPANYHDFADHSAVSGIPHAADVLSNLGFALVAIWGWLTLRPRRASEQLRAGWPGYRLFLIGLLLTAFGSAFYHLAPDNISLIWDRLPIALVCAGLIAGVRGDVKGSNSGLEAIVLALAAVASVAWWAITERQGAGDLRPYLLLQGLALILIPLWQAIYRAPRTDRIAFGVSDGAVRPGQARRGIRPRDRGRARLRHRPHVEAPDRDGRDSRRGLGTDPAIFAGRSRGAQGSVSPDATCASRPR